MGRNQHVVPSQTGGWAVKGEGAKRVTAHFKTKAEATHAARSIASNQHSELLIHGRNGRIQRRDSHGHSIFYGLAVDPANSDDYVADAIDYSQPGVVYRFRQDGTAVDTIRVGVTPGAFCFK